MNNRACTRWRDQQSTAQKHGTQARKQKHSFFHVSKSFLVAQLELGGLNGVVCDAEEDSRGADGQGLPSFLGYGKAGGV